MDAEPQPRRHAANSPAKQLLSTMGDKTLEIGPK
jgi:hypothetical protein